MVLAFTGLRWDEPVAVLIGSVELECQSMTIERTASESGGRRDVRDGRSFPAGMRAPPHAVDVPHPAAHRIHNTGPVPLVLIEVQHDDYFGEDDIIRLDDDYGRLRPEGSPRRSTGLSSATLPPSS
jgi:hypothetical protein